MHPTLYEDFFIIHLLQSCKRLLPLILFIGEGFKLQFLLIENLTYSCYDLGELTTRAFSYGNCNGTAIYAENSGR